MEDLIKRSDAIKAAEGGMCTFYDCYVIEKLKEVPSAEKQGEWIKHDEERDYCSVCKHIFKTRTLTKQDKWTTYVDDLGYNYCPHCGYRMKGADNE